MRVARNIHVEFVPDNAGCFGNYQHAVSSCELNPLSGVLSQLPVLVLGDHNVGYSLQLSEFRYRCVPCYVPWSVAVDALPTSAKIISRGKRRRKGIKENEKEGREEKRERRRILGPHAAFSGDYEK